MDAASPAAAMGAALRRGDIDAADAVLQSLGKSVPGESLEIAAEVHMRRERWAEAARLLGRLLEPTRDDQMRRQFALNMAAMREHRPELYRLLAATPDTSTYTIADTDDGPTIVYHPAGEAPVVLSGRGGPRAGLAQTLAKLKAAIDGGQPLGIHGLGDGYLIAALAASPPKLLLGMQHVVHVFVDDPAHLRAAMQIHDYAASGGPIAERRFHWHVGPDWPRQMAERVERDPMVPLPAVNVSHPPHATAAAQKLAALGLQWHMEQGRLTEEIREWAATRSAAEFAELFRPNPPRPPRVLLITSRFTTVLQHSTRDAEAGLRQLGCETFLLIEPSPAHQITVRAIAETNAQFRPDLIFTIDHLRHEYGKLFPPQIPFVCWIQDQLANLTRTEAGSTIGPRDFVLSSVAPMYTHTWGYPKRQMIDLPRLTNPPPPEVTRTRGTSTIDDLTYVSNALLDVAEARRRTMAPLTGKSELAPLVELCCERIIAVYERGDSLPTLHSLGQVIDACRAELNIAPLRPEARSKLVNLLQLPLNDACYRLQAMRWVVQTARDMNLKLGLYGLRWGDVPEFADFARGVVNYGNDLVNLTRRTRINLQIIPSTALHMRMIDGLAAGGFFLVRSYVGDTLLPRAIAFLRDHLDDTVQDTAAARAAVAPEHRAALEQMLSDTACFAELGHPIDLVAWLRCIERCEMYSAPPPPEAPRAPEALPHLDDVSFHDAATFRGRVEQYLNDEPRRREIADVQRQSVLSRLTYESGMRRMLRQMHTLLADEAAGGAS